MASAVVVAPVDTTRDVDVAPPLMVSPVVAVPPPMVEEALKKSDEPRTVPVNVGDAERTKEPVPVSSPSTPASSAEVSMLVVERRLLKEVQSVVERSPLLVPEAVGILNVMVLAEPVMVKSVPVVEVESVTVGPVWV